MRQRNPVLTQPGIAPHTLSGLMRFSSKVRELPLRSHCSLISAPLLCNECISSFPIGDPGTTADEQFSQREHCSKSNFSLKENIARRATSLSKRTLLEEQLLAMPSVLPNFSVPSSRSVLPAPSPPRRRTPPSTCWPSLGTPGPSPPLSRQ